MKLLFRLVLIFFLFLPSLFSSTPVPYSGKIAINGVNFYGNAKFTFSLQDAKGISHWQSGSNNNEMINVSVTNGSYSVLLGGQGMNPLPAKLFLDQVELYLKVHFDNED